MFERLSARLRPADPAEREAGLGIVDGHFDRLLGQGQSYSRLPDGSDL